MLSSKVAIFLMVSWLPPGLSTATLYSPSISTQNYYKATIDWMPYKDFTLCFWWKFNDKAIHQLIMDTSTTKRAMLSIFGEVDRLEVYRSERDNIIIYDNEPKLIIPRGLSQGWEYQCVSGTSSNLLLFHIGGYVDGMMKIEEKGNIAFQEPDSTTNFKLVVYQEQDSFGGGFQGDQASSGWMYCLNIWKGTFTTEQLVQKAECDEAMKGDIFSLASGTGSKGGSVDWTNELPLKDQVPWRNYGGIPTLYNPVSSVGNFYIYSSKPVVTLPAPSFTTCFWQKYEVDIPDYPISVSLATEGQTNQLLFGQNDGQIKFYYGGDSETIAGSLSQTSWQYHCAVLTIAGGDDSQLSLQYYAMEQGSITWEVNEERVLSSATAKEVNCLLVLYQDQDKYGGGFQSGQASSGWISCLNIWRGTFDSDKLLQFAKCEEKGDLFTLQEGQGYTFGEVKWTDESPVPEVDDNACICQ